LLHHTVMLRLVDGATDQQCSAIVEGLRALPGVVPGLREIDVRTDLGLAEGNAHIFFHMVFEDETSWRRYTPHQAHVELAQNWILPVLASKTAVQFAD
jgi:hypothetical protein